MSNKVYEMVTSRIIELINSDQLTSWSDGFTASFKGNAKGAYNRISKKPYSMLNQMILGKAGEWATFKQWSDLGGKIKKGEKSSIVIYWKMNTKPVLDEDGNPVLDEEGNEVLEISAPTLRYISVFHIDQIEGVEPLQIDDSKGNEAPEYDEDAETFVKTYLTRENIPLEDTQGTPCYMPGLDIIMCPNIKNFVTREMYYESLLHEMVHSTGHESRLDRIKTNANFGGQAYSKEELVAEIGCSFLMSILNLATESTIKNNAAYIKSWVSHLKNDPKLIVQASSKAEKAVKFILEGKTEKVKAKGNE